jgi:hypothetical protein
MATTVAELETRLNELIARVDVLEESVDGADGEKSLEERIQDLEDTRDNDDYTVDDSIGPRTSSVNYETETNEETGVVTITDHDGALAPRVDSMGEIVYDPNV